jgi:predicted Rossmann fold flavoprotein
MIDIAIVGGGAAGLAAAIFAARTRPDARVAVLDGAARLGAKILVSGGGRCNVTNRQVGAADYNGGDPRVIGRVLRGLSVEQTLAFFAEIGVALHEERRGKLFPDSDRARTVLDALVAECRARNIAIETSCRIATVRRRDDGFALESSQGTRHARRVVLATGGQSLPRTGSDGHGYVLACQSGHTLVRTTPALVPLLLDGALHEGLAGVSHEARVTVTASASPRRSFDGPVLWTHVGISGPAVLDSSRHWLRHRLEGRPPVLTLDCALEPFEVADARLIDAARARPRATIAAVLAERLPASMADRLAQLAGVAGGTMAELSRELRRQAVRRLTSLELPVRDSRGFNHAEVTAGGVPLSEVDAATLASRTCPGLFLVGEILDVDGRLGGFNFQWAWSSGAVAGRGAAQSLSL